MSTKIDVDEDFLELIVKSYIIQLLRDELEDMKVVGFTDITWKMFEDMRNMSIEAYSKVVYPQSLMDSEDDDEVLSSFEYLEDSLSDKIHKMIHHQFYNIINYGLEKIASE